jgi:hypothetical protein
VADKLAALGYSHLLVRRDSAVGRWFGSRPPPDRLPVAASFADSQVFAVAATTPDIYTAAMTRFGSREHDAEWSWRWMETAAAWTVVNTGSRPVDASLDLELSAFHRTRRLSVLLDGHLVQTLVVDPLRRTYQVGPFRVSTGSHELSFHPGEVPTAAGDVINDGDRRRLSFAFGTWSWSSAGEEP